MVRWVIRVSVPGLGLVRAFKCLFKLGAMANISFRNEPTTTSGELPAVGSALPSFELVGGDMNTVTDADFAGKHIVLNIFPSVDTGVCAQSVRRFNELAATWGSDEEVVAEDENNEQTEQPEEMEPVALSKKRATPLEKTVTCSYDEDGNGEFYKGLPETENVSTEGTVDITLDTSAGPIGMTLDRSVSPCTVNAIEYLVEEGLSLIHI